MIWYQQNLIARDGDLGRKFERKKKKKKVIGIDIEEQAERCTKKKV